jgi:hypothetical protein
MVELLRKLLNETVTLVLANGQGPQGILLAISEDEQAAELKAVDGGAFVVRLEHVLFVVKPGKLAIAQPQLVRPGAVQ